MKQLSERELFILARWAYSMGESLITDEEYSRLLQFMQMEYPNDDYLKRSWSSDPCPKELLQEVGRTDLIYNVTLTDATESIPSLNSWHELDEQLKFWQGNGTLSMKHDGWNIQFNYYNGELFNVHTRGRAGTNMKVERLARFVPQTIPALGRVKIVQELTVPLNRWTDIKAQFNNANPRNAVHTLLARDGTDEFLQLHAVDVHGIELQDKCKFDVFKEWGFNVPLFHKITNYDELLYAFKEMSSNKDSYGAPTDGVVFDADVHWAIRLLAWEEPIYESYVTGYIEKYSMYRINPSLAIYPVLCGGRTQRQVNITNWQRIIDNNLQIGSPIAFRNASESIADIDENTTKLLQKEYAGRWDKFADKVNEDQSVKRVQLNQLGMIYG